ncbi:hypothetical protein M0P48_05240 [Candidatus Gracilibacteria bacterium]|nr:hypothetical protein [Candidatus Gracilibacteria bacterium]
MIILSILLKNLLYVDIRDNMFSKARVVLRKLKKQIDQTHQSHRCGLMGGKKILEGENMARVIYVKSDKNLKIIKGAMSLIGTIMGLALVILSAKDLVLENIRWEVVVFIVSSIVLTIGMMNLKKTE